jgi:ankyrin repeat protein
MDAAYKGCLEVVQALLAKGADVHARDKDGKTALDVAKAEKHADVKALLEQAAAKP